jgi:hypothetical protein
MIPKYRAIVELDDDSIEKQRENINIEEDEINIPVYAS